MGIFDAIGDALSGKPQRGSSPAPAPKAQAQGDFNDDMEIKRQNNARMGLDINGDPLPKAAPPKPKQSSPYGGVYDAMAAHADKMHPVKKGK